MTLLRYVLLRGEERLSVTGSLLCRLVFRGSWRLMGLVGEQQC